MNRAALALAFALFASPHALADRAEADKLVAEGSAALQRGQVDAAIAQFTRAIEADASCARAWGYRAYAKYATSRAAASLEDFAVAISLEPDFHEWRNNRAQAYLYLDRPHEAIDDMDHMLAKFPNYPDSLCLRGWARAMAGDVDGGLADQAKALEIGGNDPRYRLRAEGFWRKGDWAALVEEMDACLQVPQPNVACYFYRTLGLVEQGKYEEAAESVKVAQAHSRGTVAFMCKLLLESTPEAKNHYNANEAQNTARLAAEGTVDSNVMITHARSLFLTGRTHECLDLLSTKGRRTNFNTLFWLGAAQWKLGRLAEARATLKDARRLNPYIARHAARIPGFPDFVASIDSELKLEQQPGQDRGRLGHELATHLLTVAEIEVLVKRYQFARAVAEYEKLLPGLKSAVRKAEVEARLPEVKGMAGAHAKLVAAAGAKPPKLKTKVGRTDLTIVKADTTLFEFTFQAGDGKFPWAYLDPIVYCELALAQNPTPDEMFGLGCLAWDALARPTAMKLFEDSLKKKPALKKNLETFLVRKRGISPPPGGFVLFRGSYVTAEEKTQLEKGLVNFEGAWVTPKDRDMLAKGMVQVSGKWVPGDEAELLKRGYKKHEGKWMSREDYEALRGEWVNAFVQETPHYTVKSNQGEAFVQDLAALMEVAYERFREYYGAEPKQGKDKMVLYAFRSYEDYRRHCVETKAEDHLNAAGFARSDSNVVVGWNKTGNEQQFLQTMVHEGAHLYFYRVSPGVAPPSWYAEAMATYFEGFAWDGKAYKFNYVSESRLPFVREAMKGGRHIPMADLMSGDALGLINSDHNKALLFYAECWSLNYYLCQTDNKLYRDAYKSYREAVSRGGKDPLSKFFPDAAKLEKDWVAFVSGL